MPDFNKNFNIYLILGLSYITGAFVLFILLFT